MSMASAYMLVEYAALMVTGLVIVAGMTLGVLLKIMGESNA